MKQSPPKPGSHLGALGILLARVLSGAWRETSDTPNISAAELAVITPFLDRTGSSALGWWCIKDTLLASSPAADPGGERVRSPTVREGSPRSSSRDGLNKMPSLTVGLLTRGSEPATVLHEAYRRFRLSALMHEQEIKYIFSLLRAEGIEPVLVKGWAIARRYPDRGLRPYGDIDICVRPDQFVKAERALKCLESLDGHYVDLHSGYAKLELWHGRPARESDHGQDAHATALWDKLFERSQLVSLGEEKIRVLGDEDHLRILCLHLLRSGAWRPLWLCDVAVALESCAADFDWDRCLTSDRKVAEWVTCTIGLAQQLLGAEARGKGKAESGRQQVAGGKWERVSGKRERKSEGERRKSPLSAFPFSLSRELPRWLAPAILRQWGRSLNPHAIEAALPALSAQRAPGKFFAEIYARWDQPVRATVALRGRFNNGPRWPYQLAELLLHSSEVPKQLAQMVRKRVNEFSPRSGGEKIARRETSGKQIATIGAR
jgi:hypothetical protein